GEQQRIALALAVACRPDVLILDEPTTGLDARNRTVVVELLRELVSQLGLATLLISHDAGLLSSVCDEIVVMEHGEIVERGPAPRVLVGRRPPVMRDAFAGSAAVLAVSGLRCRVLDGVSIAVGHGRTLGVAGESGSGKTTLLHAVAGLLRPAAGEIRLRG